MLLRGIRCDRVRIHRNLFVAVLVHVTVLLVKNVDQLISLAAAGSASSGTSSQQGYDSLAETVRSIQNNHSSRKIAV